MRGTLATSAVLVTAALLASVEVAFTTPHHKRHGKQTESDELHEKPQPGDDFDGMMYLMHFGYLSSHITDGRTRMDGTVLKSALMEFQRVANVPMTGEMDTNTMAMMSKPRCGISDVVEGEEGSRKRRYNLKERWGKTDLTYRVIRYTPDLTPPEVDKEIARALKFWSAVSSLTFTKKLFGSVDIEIQFGSSMHGDSYPFDGKGGTLAHAFYPSKDPNYKLAGDAHFDESETWTINSYKGQNLLYVAVHELGHSLGLGHSDVENSIMWPWSRGYEPDMALAIDDIEAIQMLYGTPEDRKTTTTTTTTTAAPTSTTISTTTTVQPTTPAAACSVTVNAMTSAVDGYTYAFVGDKIYRLNANANQVVEGYPKPIYDVFPTGRGLQLAHGVDAALTYYALTKRGKWRLETHLFKGDKVWMYTASRAGRMRLHRGYPRAIKKEWGIKTDKLDAVFIWGGDGGIYFLRGETLWRHDGYRGIHYKYPMKLSEHPSFGNLAAFQAALKWPRNRKNYFFVGDQYYRYVHTTGSEPVPEGPFSTARAWLGCRE